MRLVPRFVLVAAFIALLSGTAAAAGYSHVRDGWVYGLNLGYGWARVAGRDVGNAVDVESEWSGDIAGGLRIGFCPNEQIAYGLDVSGWADYAGDFDTKVFEFLAQLHWFPSGQGFYVRGGAGLGSLGLTYRSPQATVSQTKGGFTWGLGAGFEVRATPTLAIGLAYDYRRIDVGEVGAYFDDVDARVQSVTLSLSWYTE